MSGQKNLNSVDSQMLEAINMALAGKLSGILIQALCELGKESEFLPNSSCLNNSLSKIA